MARPSETVRKAYKETPRDTRLEKMSPDPDIGRGVMGVALFVVAAIVAFVVVDKYIAGKI